MTRVRSTRRSEFWTVQFVPEGGGRVRSVRLRPRYAYTAVALASALCTLGLAWLLGFLGDRQREDDLARLQAENRHLVASLSAMDRRTERLSQALDELAARDQRFRVLAGLPLLDGDVYAAGVGGPAPTDLRQHAFYAVSPGLAETSQAVSLDMDQLLRRATLLASSLSEAGDSVAAQREVLRTRPSIFPVSSEEGWISSGFSYSRLHPLLGYRRPHPGIDISAPAGSPVVASAAGRVTRARHEAGYGRVVEIDHGYGYVTRYAHLAGISVRPGQRVERGAVLGTVGRSGLTTGPNLHYEVEVEGRAVNPLRYLLDGSVRR